MTATTQMVTASRLVDGAVVYLTVANGWSETFADGAVWADKEGADAALGAGEQAAKAQLVVGPYLFEVAVTDQGPRPASVREHIRADRKPTSAPDAGSWTGRVPD